MADPTLAFALNDQTDEDTGEPVQEAIFSNTNNGAVVIADSNSLVGRRPAIGRGPAQKIVTVEPLSLSEASLNLDVTDLAGTVVANLADSIAQALVAPVAAAVVPPQIDGGSF